MDFMQWVALVVFVVTILIVISNVIDDAVAALLGATIMVWIGIVSEVDAFQSRMNHARPRRRANSPRSGGRQSTGIEMKMMLSMPNTSSSAVSVMPAIPVCGSSNGSTSACFSAESVRVQSTAPPDHDNSRNNTTWKA